MPGAKKEGREKWRANYVPAPGYYALNQACVTINRALDGFGTYLVGSSLERRDYRDVDVRYIMGDAEYERLFRNGQDWTNPLWTLMCVSISHWLSEQTGLPIDFQIQQQTAANRDHNGKRSALGIFLDYPGERPTEAVKEPKESKSDGWPDAPLLVPGRVTLPANELHCSCTAEERDSQCARHPSCDECGEATTHAVQSCEEHAPEATA